MIRGQNDLKGQDQRGLMAKRIIILGWQKS